MCELFTEAFADNCGDWCEKNGLNMTGHMDQEDSLGAQTGFNGEVMRAYRRFHIPGIDMLCGAHYYTTAKQCQSAVHQYGREGMMSELYGVTDWDFDFRGHKHHGDWQAALGVTVRVPHLAWMSMYGEAKRDYPASIFYQSPWYKEYPYIENHFARLNTALTRGKPIVDIAVIHPVESYWLHWGPADKTAVARSELESSFMNTANWLLFSGLDFDYIDEGLLPELYSGSENGEMSVGKMKYKAIIVSTLETMRGTTLKALEDFRKAGGTVIFMGGMPRYIDAEPSDAASALYNDSVRIPLSRDELIRSLDPFRNIEMRLDNGELASNYLYNYREDGNDKWLFICHGSIPSSRESWAKNHERESLTLTINGEYTPVVYDTLSGKTGNIDYTVENGKTIIRRPFYSHDSLLLKLLPYARSVGCEAPRAKEYFRTIFTRKPVEYHLDEPNALLLDSAEYRVDSASLTADGDWLPEEEILRLNNAAAIIARLPAYNCAQPWVEPPEKLTHHVDLRMTFNSEIEYDGASLAIENAPLCEILLNAVPAGKPDGYFVDESIIKVPLPKIVKGENTLLVRSPIGIRTKLEWCYLLGNFGVKIAGCEKTITALPDKLGFSTVTAQELPFYTGNIEYDEYIETPDCGIEVRVPEYTGAMIRVFLDGEDKGIIAFAPYCRDLGRVSAGKHKITYRLYGTRFNAFGALHNTNCGERWTGPNVWRTTGEKWCNEYRLRDMGITASPKVDLYK